MNIPDTMKPDTYGNDFRVDIKTLKSYVLKNHYRKNHYASQTYFIYLLCILTNFEF